jgi:hypothetical protein
MDFVSYKSALQVDKISIDKDTMEMLAFRVLFSGHLCAAHTFSYRELFWGSTVVRYSISFV